MRYIRLTFRLIIGTILLIPYLLYYVIKYRIFRFNFVRSLTNSGIPVEFAKQLATETSPLTIYREKRKTAKFEKILSIN
jgi:hypothetical protein